MKVRVKRIGKHNLPLPKYETEGASGFDLRSIILPCFDDSSFSMAVGETCQLTCGFAFEIPLGYELQVRPRSGLSAKNIVVTLGTVDSDYRGEVRILLTNLSRDPFTITHGDRIAQGVIAPVWKADLEEVEELTPTERGANGFGSTGTR